VSGPTCLASIHTTDKISEEKQRSNRDGKKDVVYAWLVRRRSGRGRVVVVVVVVVVVITVVFNALALGENSIPLLKSQILRSYILIKRNQVSRLKSKHMLHSRHMFPKLHKINKY
jgi:Metal-dependent hydrolase involved in phosphonate metabolism